MINFFELTDKGFDILDEGFVLYEPFNRLWKRDKTPTKDVATEELKYIYFLCDYRSRGIWQGYKGKDLISYAISHCDLPKDWEEDEVISDCIRLYIFESEGIKVKVLKSLMSSLSTTNKAIQTLDDKLDEIITNFSNAGFEGNSADTIKMIHASVEAITKYATDIPKKLNELDGAIRSAHKEQVKKSEGRSGIQLTDSMNPKILTRE